jgi:flagellar biosynthesis/type III secretory pathway M-ring protein FliF/YscJ
MEAPSSQAIVVGPAAIWVFIALVGVLAWMARELIMSIRDHKAKTEAELEKKASKEELKLNLDVVGKKLDLILESNEKQIEGRAEFLAWTRRQKEKSHFPGSGGEGT